MSREIDERLVRARVLLELGWIPEAELETLRVLDDVPEDLTAISLFAKIKHIRGQLSQAIGCWAHIHRRSPHNETAMMQLRALFDLARDPERAASEFLVLGGDHVARKPAVQFELEQAFALFHERRPDEARVCCAQIAARHKGRDAQLYKLAVIGRAWLAELSGDLAAARGELEQLGLERGFEHDLDRLLALVRVYDRIGTPETVEAAAKICRHVLRELEAKGIEKISLLSRLASLERRAGRADNALQFERAYLVGLRRRMHRPSLGELVRVAAREYVPLERLALVRPAGDDLPGDLPRRERALVHALREDRAQARAMFADGGERLDRCYLADLAALDGDRDQAIELYLDSLGDAPSDLHLLGWLLDHHAHTPSPAIASYLADGERLRHAIAAFVGSNIIAPLRPEPWRRLALLHELAGDIDDASRCSLRADALDRTAATRAMPIGRVLAASVYHFTGKTKGLLHEVWVHRAPTHPGRGGTLASDDIHGNVTPEMRAAIRNTFVAVREYARAKFPLATRDLDHYTYSYKLPKEDEPSGGLSAGLPSALAFLSVFLQRPVPQGVASSGALITEAHDVITIGRVGDVDYKVKAAYHANARTLILPLAHRADLEHSALAPPEISREIVQYAGDLDRAVELVFGAEIFLLA